MNKSLYPLWTAVGLLAVLVGFFAVAANSQADEVDDAVANGVAYLQGQSDEATKTMALVAAGESVDVSYLQDFSGSAAIDYAKPIMAIAAAGENPATYAEQDLVAKLKSFAGGSQMGSADQVNDDIWGILALRAAGVSASDSAIQNSKTFLLDNQNPDGGWAWNVGGASDTNDTAAAVMALLETGMNSSDSAVQNAVAFMESAQNEDGGFPYDPHPSTGSGQADSDANSDAWAIMMFNKLGQNTGDATSHLLSLQDESDGGFWWMPPPAEFNNKGATADAVIALSGKSYPVAFFEGEDNSDNGTGNSGNDSSTGSGQATEVKYRIVGSEGEICTGSGSNIENALQVVVHGAGECGYNYDIQDTSFGKYVASIAGETAEGQSGWMYAVNDEVPEAGAAEYSLSGGEQVVWFFGEVGDDPPAPAQTGSGDVSDSVDLSVEIVDGSGQDDEDQASEEPEVAFSVSPSSLDFGQLLPGDSAGDQLVLQNQGQVDVSVEAEVQGSSVFHFLELEGTLWDAFSFMLSSGAQEQVQAQLAVPPEFNSFGQKQGTLIFWAEAED